MRLVVLIVALASAAIPVAVSAQQRPPLRSDVQAGIDDRYYDDRYDDRSVANIDAAQRRFDIAQQRFDRERDIYERERAAFEDSRARYEADRDRQPSYQSQTWRGDDGQVYCRRRDGTTGTIVGGVAGGLLGRAIDGGRRSAVGTIIGAGAGALAGRSVEKNMDQNCR